MATRAGTTRTFTISFPKDLAAQVDRLAAKESRTTSELFREAFRTYRAERVKSAFANLQALSQSSETEAFTQDDIERFVDEVRSEEWETRRAIRK